MLTSHRVPVHFPAAPFATQLPANGLAKTMEAGPGTWAPATHWEAPDSCRNHLGKELRMEDGFVSAFPSFYCSDFKINPF